MLVRGGPLRQMMHRVMEDTCPLGAWRRCVPWGRGGGASPGGVAEEVIWGHSDVFYEGYVGGVFSGM